MTLDYQQEWPVGLGRDEGTSTFPAHAQARGLSCVTDAPDGTP